jgi:hypothetical protein
MTASRTIAFVDALEDDVVRLLIGGEAFTVPRALLPAGAGEGSWIALWSAVVPAPPGDTEERRRRLGQDDPGGDIDL